MGMKFFHLQRNKPFQVKYRYFDPEKEERELRNSKIKKELGIEDEKKEQRPYSPNIRGQFRGARDARREGFIPRKESRKMNVRFIIIALILSAIAYYFLG